MCKPSSTCQGPTQLNFVSLEKLFTLVKDESCYDDIKNVQFCTIENVFSHNSLVQKNCAFYMSVLGSINQEKILDKNFGLP